MFKPRSPHCACGAVTTYTALNHLFRWCAIKLALKLASNLNPAFSSLLALQGPPQSQRLQSLTSTLHNHCYHINVQAKRFIFGSTLWTRRSTCCRYQEEPHCPCVRFVSRPKITMRRRSTRVRYMHINGTGMSLPHTSSASGAGCQGRSGCAHGEPAPGDGRDAQGSTRRC